MSLPPLHSPGREQSAHDSAPLEAVGELPYHHQMELRVAKLEQTVEQLHGEIPSLRTDIHALRAEFHTDLKDLRNELNAKIDKVSAELNAKIDKVSVELNTKIDKMSVELNAKIDTIDAELRSEMRAIRSDIEDIKAVHHADFRLLFGAIIAVALGMAGLMAKGFSWI